MTFRGETNFQQLNGRQLDKALHAFYKQSRWICFEDLKRVANRYVGEAVSVYGTIGWLNEDDIGTEFVMHGLESQKNFASIFASQYARECTGRMHRCDFFVRYPGGHINFHANSDTYYVYGFLGGWSTDLVNQYGTPIRSPLIDAEYVK
jgi:hypothetical protein